MRAIHDTSIKILLAGALAACGVMIGVIATLNTWSRQDTDTTFAQVKRVNVQEFGAASAAKNVLDRARLSLDAAEYDEGLVAAGKDGARFGQAALMLGSAVETTQRFTSLAQGMDQQATGLRLTHSFQATLAALQAHARALRKGDAAAAADTRKAASAAAADLEDAFTAFTQYADQHFVDTTRQTERQEARFSYVTFGTLGAALLLLGALYFALRHLVITPLAEAGDELQRIARADLSHDVRNHGRNEIGNLFGGLREMQRSLRTIVANVRTGCDSILTGASEIATGNTDLASRTEEQSAAVTETASSTEEITSTVKQTAEHAVQAAGLADTASTTARQGGEAMGRVAATMHAIADSSRKVEEITGMIDAIAFQTNILALNASVEAARAGEQGRGFAVVATEVRNLAGRSSTAARDIKQLIEASSTQIHAGVALVDRATATMDEVVASVKRVNALMEEISAASHEQSTGVEQIGQAMSQMDQVTQQNAALVQQTAAAAASLEEQSKRLQAEVAVFRLPDTRALAPKRGGIPATREVAAMTRHIERLAMAQHGHAPQTSRAPTPGATDAGEWSAAW